MTEEHQTKVSFNYVMEAFETENSEMINNVLNDFIEYIRREGKLNMLREHVPEDWTDEQLIDLVKEIFLDSDKETRLNQMDMALLRHVDEESE